MGQRAPLHAHGGGLCFSIVVDSCVCAHHTCAIPGASCVRANCKRTVIVEGEEMNALWCNGQWQPSQYPVAARPPGGVALSLRSCNGTEPSPTKRGAIREKVI